MEKESKGQVGSKMETWESSKEPPVLDFTGLCGAILSMAPRQKEIIRPADLIGTGPETSIAAT